MSHVLTRLNDCASWVAVGLGMQGGNVFLSGRAHRLLALVDGMQQCLQAGLRPRDARLRRLPSGLSRLNLQPQPLGFRPRGRQVARLPFVSARFHHARPLPATSPLRTLQQDRPAVPLQRVRVHLFARLRGSPSVRRAAPSLPDPPPVGGPVAGPHAARPDMDLQQYRTVAGQPLPVARQVPRRRPLGVRAQTPHTHPPRQEIARVPHHKPQLPAIGPRPPADPAVPAREPPGCEVEQQASRRASAPLAQQMPHMASHRLWVAERMLALPPFVPLPDRLPTPHHLQLQRPGGLRLPVAARVQRNRPPPPHPDRSGRVKGERKKLRGAVLKPSYAPNAATRIPTAVQPQTEWIPSTSNEPLILAMLLRIAEIGSLITTKRNEVGTLAEFRSGS